MGKSTDNFFIKKKDWSKIKDDILACYLKPYFTKIQATKKETVYIDGFAGKGRFDDGSAGSPLIAYNIAQNINSNMDISFVFIENKYYNSLKESVAGFRNATVISGNYEDNIIDLINNNSGKNLFVYIDPFGIKNLNFSYFKLLNSTSLNSAEFLMNLNSFGFIREGCRLMKTNLSDVVFDNDFDSYMDETEEFLKSNSISKMNSIAGGNYWQDIIREHQSGAITGYLAEKKFVDAYCEKIKKTGKFKYVINVPIRLKTGSPPKYRLVFATNHKDGVILMNDNMSNKFDKLLEIQSGGYISLFQENSENDLVTSNDIINNIISELDLDYKEYSDVVINYIEKYGIVKSSILNELLKKLEEEGVIFIKRIPNVTPTGRPARFIVPSKRQNLYIRLKGE